MRNKTQNKKIPASNLDCVAPICYTGFA